MAEENCICCRTAGKEEMFANGRLKAYIQETLPELKELIVELCGIPAPSHHEEKRAEFCRDWLLRNGASPEQVHIDEALNVVCEVPGENR